MSDPVELFFMSPPRPDWALRGRANFRSREAPGVDARAARREWLALARAIEARGGRVVALESPNPALTGMPYAAEAGHVLEGAPGERPRYLLPRMASAHRQGERAHWASLARSMGFEVLDPVPEGEGIWEGQGDVAAFDGATLLFFGGRTNRAGLEAVAPLFEASGGEVLRFEIREPAFHGNMALLPLREAGVLLACPEVFAPGEYARLVRRFGEARVLPVSEAEIRSYATNGLPVGRALLAPSLVPPRIAALAHGRGVEVLLLRMRELCEKAGGASRCLVMRARIDSAALRFAPGTELAAVAARIESESEGEREGELPTSSTA